MAAQQLSFGVNTRLLAGEDSKTVAPIAEEALALARRAGSPGAVAQCLSSLALALVDSDADRARALLRESVGHGTIPGQGFTSSLTSTMLAAGRLQDWNLTLALAGRALWLYRWSLAPVRARGRARRGGGTKWMPYCPVCGDRTRRRISPPRIRVPPLGSD